MMDCDNESPSTGTQFVTGSGDIVKLSESIILDFDISEDELEVGDLDELDEQLFTKTVQLPDAEPDNSTDEDEPTVTPPVFQDEPSTSTAPQNKPTRYDKKSEVLRNIVWKQTNLKKSDSDTKFSGDDSLPPTITNLQTPYQFFRYFFTDELLQKIIEETTRYGTVINPERPFIVSRTDVLSYIGILILTSIMTAKNIRFYWKSNIGMSIIQEAMTVNKFEKIRQFLHFNNNANLIPHGQPGYDPLFKIRPVFDSLRERFSSIPVEERLAVDEQMCSTKARHHLRMYMPAKPHKYGFKLFVLAGMTGYAYNFEVYTGQENADIRDGEPNLGASGNVVLRLARIIPRGGNYKIYFDNYYTSVQLLVYLSTQGILSLGTVRADRIPGSKLPVLKTAKEVKSVKRGTFYEYVANIEGCEVSSLMWVDNKCVRMLSTFAGANPVEDVRRYNRTTKKHEMIQCPHVIREYNKHMGGVDLLDSLVGRYKIIMRTKKWYFRLFYHLMDLTVINAWIMYTRIAKNDPSLKPLSLAEFRIELGETLCKIDSNQQRKRGRPSDAPPPPPPPMKKTAAATSVPKDVRYDGVGHWPVHIDKSKQRCKLEGCKGFTVFKCDKCNMFLCLNKNNNCFRKYHVR